MSCGPSPAAWRAHIARYAASTWRVVRAVSKSGCVRAPAASRARSVASRGGSVASANASASYSSPDCVISSGSPTAFRRLALTRLQLADLVLDTWHYNAHATAGDALWAGVPVLTRRGATFAGRVGASVLEAVGLPDLVTRSSAEYEALALALAGDRPRLAALRARLAAGGRTQPLFDTARTTRHVEAAYLAMWARHAAGLGPEHIDVSQTSSACPSISR